MLSFRVVLFTAALTAAVLTATSASAQVKFCGKTWDLEAKTLNCAYPVESNLIPLRRLTALEEVTLVSGKAKNLIPLVHLPNLKRLAIQTYEIPKGALKVLTQLPGLQSLNLAGTKLESATDVGALSQLEELDLTDTGLTSLKPLANLKKLKALGLKGLKKLKGLKVLAKMTGLEKLDLGDTEIRKLKFLKKLTKLTDLTLPDETNDLKLVAKMTGLKRLVVRRTGAKDVSMLANLTALEELILDVAPAVKDWSPLAKLTKLRRLDLNSGEVGDLKWLIPMRETLTILSLRNAQIAGGLNAIGDLRKLRFLSLASTATTKIDQLRKLKNLELLDLSGTHVRNLKALNGSTRLRKLDLSNTNVTQGEVARIKRVLPKVQIRYDLFLQ